MGKESGTLKAGQPHPMAYHALAYIRQQGLQEVFGWIESFSSCAIEGNEVAEICGETLRRIMAGEPVSDRYVLGLAWFIKNNIEGQ
jgi:hypothetical protein